MGGGGGGRGITDPVSDSGKSLISDFCAGVYVTLPVPTVSKIAFLVSQKETKSFMCSIK